VIRQRILESAASRRAEALDLLESLIKVNSYWGNPDGVNRVGDLVLDQIPDSVKLDASTDGNGVRHYLLTSPSPEKSRILLVGHLDTVFPPDSETTPFSVNDGKVMGPGTADMKGGIVVLVQALKILDDVGLLDRIPLKILMNGDEEVGSPFSSGMVKELASEARCGLIFECGSLGNQVVVGRRGVIRFNLTATGKARHAGVKEGPKASAIVELARIVLALEGLNDHARSISINVGTVHGGEANNIVPDLARATFEFRFKDSEAEKEIVAKVQDIVSDVSTPGCAATLETQHRRPCMISVPGSDDLVSTLMETAKELGQSVGTEERGGASDGNFLSEMGVPVIDGLGPKGDMDHSPDEFIVEDSLYERIELTALLLVRLAGLEG
jgi:glutamate carboxypeptidase